MPKLTRSVIPMISTTGAAGASAGTRIRPRRAIARVALWVIRISTTMATGDPRNMATHGFRESIPDGLRITRGTGHGSIPGDGPGWTMRTGDTLRFITAAGRICTGDGDGSQDLRRSDRGTRLRLSLLLAVEHLWQAARSRGSLLDRVKSTCPRTA